MALRGKFYKDKERLRKTRNAQRKRYYSQTAIYQPRHWTVSELELLSSENLTDRELSKKLSRSVQSIQAKRHRLRNDMLNV